MPCEGQVDTRPNQEARPFPSGPYEDALLMSMNVELWLLKHMCECVKHVRPYSITQADFLYVFFTYWSLMSV